MFELKNEFLIHKASLYSQNISKKTKVFFFKLSSHNQIAFSHSPFLQLKVQKNFGKKLGIYGKNVLGNPQLSQFFQKNIIT